VALPAAVAGSRPRHVCLPASFGSLSPCHPQSQKLGPLRKRAGLLFSQSSRRVMRFGAARAPLWRTGRKLVTPAVWACLLNMRCDHARGSALISASWYRAVTARVYCHAACAGGHDPDRPAERGAGRADGRRLPDRLELRGHDHDAGVPDRQHGRGERRPGARRWDGHRQWHADVERRRRGGLAAEGIRLNACLDWRPIGIHQLLAVTRDIRLLWGANGDLSAHSHVERVLMVVARGLPCFPGFADNLTAVIVFGRVHSHIMC